MLFLLTLIKYPSVSKTLLLFFSLQSVQNRNMAIILLFWILQPVAWRAEVMPLDNVYRLLLHLLFRAPTRRFCSLMYFPLIILLIISPPCCFLSLSSVSLSKIWTFLHVSSLPLFTLFYSAFLRHLISSLGFTTILPTYLPSSTFKNFILFLIKVA